MSKLFTRATVSGASLSGANLKSVLTTLWDALNSLGITDASRTTVTSSASLVSTQCGLLLVDATSASIVLTLPTSGSATDDLVYSVRRIDSSTANSVTVVRGGTDTIEGSTSAILIPPGGSTKIQMPGGATNWRVLSASGGTAVGARNNISASDSPFRNRVINGNCLIDQRNAGAAQTFTAAAALAYCIDRFYGYCTGANATGQQITASDGTKRYRYTGAASVTGIGHGHRIESVDSVDLAGNVCTLSVKLANSLLTTVSWAAFYANSADTFGTLASPTRTSIGSGTFTVNGTEATYSAQLNVPSGATTGIEIVLSVGAQTSGTWQIGDVMLEKGAIPALAITPERVEFSDQMRRCQRYYQKSYELATALAAATTAGASHVPYTAASSFGQANIPYTEMRAQPTLSYWDCAGNASRVSLINGTTAAQTDNNNFVSTSSLGQKGGWIRMILGATAGSCMYQWSASAEL